LNPSRTALVDAELENAEEHVSHTVYIALPFQCHDSNGAGADNKYTNKSLVCVVWTTAQWIIPANQALWVNAGRVRCDLAALEWTPLSRGTRFDRESRHATLEY
jgi:isoleucyl-tRNA synthetase